MSSSLRDQLVKAGLATSAQARQAERAEASARHKKKGSKKGKGAQQSPAADDPAAVAKARARQQRAEKASRDKAIAKVRNAKAAEKALRAEIKQIVKENDQRPESSQDSDVAYNFVHGKKVKRLYLPQPLAEGLSAGRLVIVNNDGRYHVLPEAAAAKIRARDPRWIVTDHRADGGSENPPEASADDAFYAQFEVPDDLDW